MLDPVKLYFYLIAYYITVHTFQDNRKLYPVIESLKGFIQLQNAKTAWQLSPAGG
jgi:hypothetical protein